ncbi:MAG TPA: caspase family protein, partial [Nitrososphaeraceae archaeon]|nr:caspase family protein [Nitrososphaeraceae archaeon]
MVESGIQNPDNNSLHVLLIACDYYLPNNLPQEGQYPNLGGCVRDITHVENFLKQKMSIPEENIIKLTSSIDNDGNGPLESQEKLPTYSNIINAFTTLTEKAQKGDQVYIHYSGHGGRTPTHIPKIKGINGLDETLVPIDIGNASTRYVRDTEIAKLIERMLEKGLVVTMVLDSCHSGGATRGKGGAVARGINIIDTTQRPQDSMVASIEELENTWKNLDKSSHTTADDNYTKSMGNARSLQVGSSGWLPQIKGYVLLAACRPSESAYEYSFEGNERNGALTYWLLKSLSMLDRETTFKQLHDRIIAKIHSQFPLQTPMLEGDGNRKVFGFNFANIVYAVNVMQVDLNKKRILLNTGQVHGIRKGAKFAIYPTGLTDFSKVEKRLAIVEIDERGSTNSWGKIITDFNKGVIEAGAQAVLIDPVDLNLKKRINLVGTNSDLDSSTKKRYREAIDFVKEKILEISKESFLELTTPESNNADFQVAINEKGEYEIWDPAGQPIPNLNPPLMIDDQNSVSILIQRLVHLSKYMNIQQIDNLDAASPLARKLVVELFGVSKDYDPADRPDLLPLESQGNLKIVKVGQKMVLRIKNNLPKASNQVLNVAILALQSDWAVNQIYPTNPGENFIPIDPEGEEFFPIEAALPENYESGKDILKVFATIDQTSFRSLELPVLDQQQPITTYKKEITRGGGG